MDYCSPDGGIPRPIERVPCRRHLNVSGGGFLSSRAGGSANARFRKRVDSASKPKLNTRGSSFGSLQGNPDGIVHQQATLTSLEGPFDGGKHGVIK